jgi:hypothetical protein
MPLPFRPQFRLRTLLLAFVPIAVASFFVHQYVYHQPLHWDRYNLAVLQEELSQGHAVLVYVDGMPSCGQGGFVPNPCRNDRVMQFARAHRIKALRASSAFSVPGEHPRAVDRLLVYSPDQPDHARLIPWWNRPKAAEELLSALRTASEEATPFPR